MTTDDLANAMDDQGITVKKPPYFIQKMKIPEQNKFDYLINFAYPITDFQSVNE